MHVVSWNDIKKVRNNFKKCTLSKMFIFGAKFQIQLKVIKIEFIRHKSNFYSSCKIRTKQKLTNLKVILSTVRELSS